MKKIILSSFVLPAAMMFSSHGAPPPQIDPKPEAEYDENLALLRKDWRSGKKQLIAANLSLTDAEAAKFWTIYNRYAAELAVIYDERAALIKEYAANYLQLTDQAAASLTKRDIDNEQAITQLRQKYQPLIDKILPGKKAALFFQLDRRFGLLIDLQLAFEIPLAAVAQ